MIADYSPYVFLLIVMGCLTVAMPIYGVLAVFGGVLIAMKVHR